MRALSQTLTDLIVQAEALVARPMLVHVSPWIARFRDLASEVHHADALPAEGARATRAAIVMVTAIEGFRADGKAESPWLMLVGCTLPLLRTDAWIAFSQEKEARGQ